MGAWVALADRCIETPAYNLIFMYDYCANGHFSERRSLAGELKCLSHKGVDLFRSVGACHMNK